MMKGNNWCVVQKITSLYGPKWLPTGRLCLELSRVLGKMLPLSPSVSPPTKDRVDSRFKSCRAVGSLVAGQPARPHGGLPPVGTVEQTSEPLPLPFRAACVPFPIPTDAFGSEMAQDYESHWHHSIPSAILKVCPGPLVLSHAHTGSLQFSLGGKC